MITKKKSPHVITSRDKGATDYLLVNVASAIFIIFILCSAYAIMLSPANPAAWSMAAFFIIGFVMLLGWEDNIFPDLPRKKVPFAIMTWFFAWVFAAFLVSFLVTFNISHLTLAVLIGVFLGLTGSYTMTNEQQWGGIKEGIRTKPGAGVRKAFRMKEKPKKQKKPKKQRKPKKPRTVSW